jgi:non-specific serine/threonine protein kinase
LTGPGGIGKTRLALHAAAELLDDFASGVFFVPLSAIREPELIVPAIAKVLGMREVAGDGLLETVAAHLADKHLLLVIDNLEHVVGGVAALSSLLTAAPALRILATSRERLQLSGERVYAVPALPLPNADDLSTLAQTPATALFLARAAAVKGDFELTRQNAGAVRGICEALDGLPLAIELAAARIPLLRPEALLNRLGERLKVLTGGTRDVEERQRTLRNTIAWSYELLTAEEQRLFERLSVFSGGCTIEAAEQVADVGLDQAQAFVERSLLRRTDERLGMLATIREYAEERLEEREAHSEVEDLRLRHLSFFTALAEQAHRELMGPSKGEWVERIGADLENARAALGWEAQATEAAELQLRLAAALRLFWDAAGSTGEGLAWIERGLARVPEPAAQLRYDAYLGASAFASQLGDFDKAFDYDARALAAAQEVGDAAQQATALMRTAIDMRRTGQLARARALYEEALALTKEIGDDHRAGAITHNLGDLALAEGDLERARGLFAEALANARTRSDSHETAYALCNLALASLRLEGPSAHASLCEALAIIQDLAWPFGAAYAVELAGAALARSDSEGAARLLAAAESMRLALQLPLEPFEQMVHDESMEVVERALGSERLAGATELGRATPSRDAVAYAIHRLRAAESSADGRLPSEPGRPVQLRP